MKSLLAATIQRIRALFVFCLMAGCASLPSTGPSKIDIALDDAADAEVQSRFTVLPLDWRSVELLGKPVSRSFGSALGGNSRRPGTIPLGAGDQLVITVWEPSADGLFSSAGIKQTPIEAVVDERGAIFVPYAGQIDVAGLSVEDVRNNISRKLVGQAIDPQVQVAQVGSSGSAFSVVGDVAGPGQYEIPPRGLRLIDAIALARGPSEDSFETEVSVQRGDVRGTVRLEDVLAGGANNIWLSPRDTVRLKHKPLSFTVFGAVTAQNLQGFQTDQVSLAEALAQSGGLNDNLADAGGVFLFRYEPSSRLQRVNARLPAQANQAAVPTIYQLDFTTPDAFFLAQSFAMRDKDIIYVANAPATEFQKFTRTILSPLVGSVQSVNNLTN